MRAVITVLAALVFSCMPASAGADDASFHDIDGGWHEAWIGVSDLQRMRIFFEEVAGWRVIAKGKLDDATLRYIAPDASRGRYLVLAPSDYPQGWVRLIDIDGVDRRIIRRHAQAWDNGGIFSLMTRTASLESNLAEAETLGWTAYNTPYFFGFGNLKLANAVMRGPDGVNIAAYEWIEPKRDDVPPAGSLSKAFNAMQMVADLDRSVAFYESIGFRIIQRGSFIDPAETPTNFALPVNFSTKIRRNYAIMIPENGNDEAGRIELMQFEGITGRDLSDAARLEGLGVASLLFPVSDLDAAETLFTRAAATIARPRAAIDLVPYGRVEAMTIRSPEGALLTFFEPLGK